MGLSLQTPLCQLQPATTLGVILLRKTHVSILAPNEDRKHSAKLPKKLKWFYLFIYFSSHKKLELYSTNVERKALVL